ncbi:MAG TPA: DNA primase [Acetobacteraceae bacterium]|nr:DNA primase [Acetobacteraceae bacterium]
MALSPGFLEELRSRTPLAAVVGRRVKLARSGRQMKGCCPFHNEKTPSFYVYEDGYHCFGCGAHGDAITFVMQTQGAGFMEAVQQLAAEAGLQVPLPSPEAAEVEQRRHDLAAVLQAAQDSYQRRLYLPEGRHALAYLRGRGLSEATIRQFGLGWSGEGRGALAAGLARDGITADRLVEAGLMRRDDETGRIYDLFYNRVMFPIRDRRGRVISFGGRILGDGQPKYLNGPETDLFSKRRNLYALDLAREAVRGGARLVVVEGYMDVIALHQAGFGGAVAPLGTALTEEQLSELWRISPEPVLCFDGDAAGARAAARAAELALPLLAPDRTLRIATLPGGEDPDTLVRRQGPGGCEAVLTAARPLADALYDLLREAAGDATPEQRAAFRTRLDQAARRIADKALSDEYLNALRGRFYADRRAGRVTKIGGAYRSAPPRSMPRPRPSASDTDHERARILTAILLHHPVLLPDVDHAYAAMALPAPLARLREAVRAWADLADVLDSRALIDHLTMSGLQAEMAQVLAAAPVPLPACVLPAAMPAEAEAGWWHIFGFLNLDHLREEVKLAETEAATNLTEETQRRALSLKAALIKVMAGEPDGVELAA